MGSIFDAHEFNSNLFFPRPDFESTPSNMEDLFIEVESEVVVHVRKYPNPNSKFSMLYFHGNGEIVSDYNDIEPAFSKLGAEFIIADYRGYGKSTGFPTLRMALEDSLKIYQYLKQEKHFRDKVFVMGRSLGSASAIELCRNISEISGCIIESGYADPIPLVERRGLKIKLTTPEEDELFNNSKKISGVTCPLLIMHGKMDFLISPQEAQQNFRSAGSKKKHLELFDGVGHNDILMAANNGYFLSLHRFLSETLYIL